jgi:hypothetical protein
MSFSLPYSQPHLLESIMSGTTPRSQTESRFIVEPAGSIFCFGG